MIPYRVLPYNPRHPAFPNDVSCWLPLVGVCVSVGHGQKSKRIEALVDSGAEDTIFHASLAAALKIDLKAGIFHEIGGVAAGVKIPVYFHDVHLWVGVDRIKIRAGFSEGMSIGALLGRRGFFEHFLVTFDPCAHPPGFSIQRIGRA